MGRMVENDEVALSKAITLLREAETMGLDPFSVLTKARS